MTAHGVQIRSFQSAPSIATLTSHPGLAEAASLSAPTRRRAEEGLRTALVRQSLLLVFLALVAAPAVTPLAAWVRWSFPAACALFAGGLLLRGRAGLYVTFCLWLFVLTPFVRRLVDGQAGYSEGNVLMLAPYLAASWAALALPRFFLTRGRPAQWPMALVFAAILYGFVLALAAGRLFPATLDLLRWSIPPLLACYVIVRTKAWEAICVELRAFALVALPLVSLYGLYQFVAPPLWDASWMLNSGMSSIGRPRPFEIRVFATMNSPASLAYYLEALLLLTLSLKPRLSWLSVGLGMAALAVTLVRSAWLGLATGLLLFLVRAPLKVRASALMLVVAGVSLAPLALTNARVEKVVSERVDTLWNVGNDKSFSERMSSYSAFVRELEEAPGGQGFGIANVSAKYTQRGRVIDGGPIEILLSLGVLFGTLYLGAVATVLIAAIMWPLPDVQRGVFVATVTIATVQVLALSSATTVVGEIGILFWLAIGLALAAPKSRSNF